jgi:hypothetical protein
LFKVVLSLVTFLLLVAVGVGVVDTVPVLAVAEKWTHSLPTLRHSQPALTLLALVRQVQARLPLQAKAAQAERLLFLVVLCPPSRHWAAAGGEVVSAQLAGLAAVAVVGVMVVQAARLRGAT